MDFQFQKVGCGSNFTIVVAKKKLFSFGNNQIGQLGIGVDEFKEDYSKPVMIPNSISLQISGISCGPLHAVAWDE